MFSDSWELCIFNFARRERGRKLEDQKGVSSILNSIHASNGNKAFYLSLFMGLILFACWVLFHCTSVEGLCSIVASWTRKGPLFFSFFAVLFYDSIAFWFSLGSFVCCLYISNRFVTFVLGEHYNLQEGQILMLFPSLGCLLKWRIRFRTRRTLCVEVGLIGVADRQCRLVLTLFV
jgi:hypothetical protein